MSDRQQELTASACLVVGAVLGMAGSFVPSPELRGLAWGVDGIALVTAGALLAVHFIRDARTLTAAGFLVFAAAETLIVSGSAMDLAASTPLFGAGSGLWAAALTLISFSGVYHKVVRGLGLVAAILFASVAVRIFCGEALTPLSRPFPFFAYPFLVATLVGWAWHHGVRKAN